MTVTDAGVDLSLQQFIAAWSLMCAGAPTCRVEEAEGLHYIFSGVPIPFFNVAVLTGRRTAGDELKSRATAACAWAAGRSVPWLFVVTHETLEPSLDPAAVLDRCDLAPIMPLTGMIADRIAPPARTADDLELTVPQDDEGLSSIISVNALAYAMELEAGRPLIGRRSFWNGHFPVLGLRDGKAACSAAVLMIDGYRYVALVATDPAQQRRGYGEAAMRRALEHAAAHHGERPTVLHATEAGRPIYERMGYTPISTHTVFMEKKFLVGH
jgi:GNAT superfamily N-acetyltransferase